MWHLYWKPRVLLAASYQQHFIPVSLTLQNQSSSTSFSYSHLEQKYPKPETYEVPEAQILFDMWVLYTLSNLITLEEKKIWEWGV